MQDDTKVERADEMKRNKEFHQLYNKIVMMRGTLNIDELIIMNKEIAIQLMDKVIR